MHIGKKISVVGILVLLLAGCESSDVQAPDVPPAEEPTAPVQEVVSEEEKAINEEYLRSIQGMEGETVSKQEFLDDKAAILKIIDDMSVIMAKQDYNRWVKYIEPVSLTYYSNPVNLKKAQKKLPNKSIAMNNANDYFKNVFIPSRRRSQVDEIRYISKTNAKAVRVKEDESITVYYNFVKISTQWYVQLPTL